MIIDDVEIKACGFRPAREELANYVEFVKNKVNEVDKIKVTLCEDGMVDVTWTKHNPPFERIRRITGEPIK